MRPSASVTGLRAALAADSTDASRWCDLGGAYARDGEYGEAVGAFEQALAREPGSVTAWYQLARVQLRIGRYAKAVIALRRAIELRPASATLHNSLGFALTRHAVDEAVKPEVFRPDIMLEALAAYDAALGLDSLDAAVYFNRAAVYDNLGELEKAAAGYRRAIELASAGAGGGGGDLGQAHHNLGLLATRQQDHEAAVAAHARAAQLRPESADFHYELGLAHGQLHDHEQGIAAFERAVELDPPSARAHYALANLLFRAGRVEDGRREMGIYRRLGERSEEIQQLRVALRKEPENPEVHAALGTAYARAGDPSQAIEEYRIAVALAPERGDLRGDLGKLYIEVGDLDRAASTLEAGVALQPDDASMQANLGGLYLASGDFEAAARLLRTSLELDPAQPKAAFNLGLAHARRGDLMAAEAQLRHAVAIDSGYLRAHRALAQVLEAAERPQEAVAVLEEAHRIAPGDRPLGLDLVQAYTRAGRQQDAERLRAQLPPDEPRATPR